MFVLKKKKEVCAQQNAKYRPTAIMGEGAFGTVYKVSDTTTGEIKALKLLKMTIPTAEIPLISREISLLLTVKHANIVSTDNAYVIKETKNEIFDVRTVPRIAIVMELCDSDLEKKLKGRIIIDAYWNNAIIKQLITGVHYLHENGVIHRDLKPANILFKGHTLKIGDFGLAKGGVFSKAANHSVSLGTPLYMPPEVRDGKQYDKTVDIYSMGFIFVELYCKARDFEKWIVSSRGDFSGQLLKAEHQLPPRLVGLVTKMIQIPTERPPLTEIYKYFSNHPNTQTRVAHDPSRFVKIVGAAAREIDSP